MEEKVLFYEKQRISQWWLWTIVILSELVPFFISLAKMGGIDKIAANPMIFLIAVGTHLIFILISIFLISLIKLEMRITDQGVYVRLFPLGLSFKFYPFSNMTACYIRKYHPVREYGGWGYKGRHNNRALSIRGDTGLQMEFSNGNKLIVGTRRPQEIIEILKSLENKMK